MSLQKKVVLVGDGCTGKSYLVETFVTGIYPSFWKATTFEHYEADVEVDGSTMKLYLWDTAGVQDFDRLRPMSYPKTDVILICFSIGDTDSFKSVTTRWWPEVKRFCPKVPIVLVGTKSDIREDGAEIARLARLKETPFTKNQGEDLAKEIGAVAYIECSALTNFNVKEVFTTAAKATMRKPKMKKDNPCVLM